MTTLYKRATPRQDKVLRMIEGACLNAAHAHPEWDFDPRFATSIAKRATGTLTAQWRDVLAAPLAERSDREDGDLSDHPAPGEKGTVLSRKRPKTTRELRTRGHARYAEDWRVPLRGLHKALGIETGNARRAGELERASVLIEILRLIANSLGSESVKGR